MNKREPKSEPVREVAAAPTILDQDGADLLLGNSCPGPLQTQEFAEAWMAWWNFRHFEKKKRLTPTTVRLQLKFLAELGWSDDAAIASLEQSMRNGWQGLFEPRNFKPYPPAPGSPQVRGESKQSQDLRRIMERTNNERNDDDAPHKYRRGRRQAEE
jgi:hypothetical protein